MCDENINLEEYRSSMLAALSTDPADTEAMAELMCADCLICEDNIKDLGPSWRNTPFVEEILRYAPRVAESGQTTLVANVCERVADTLSYHPRLTLRLMRQQRMALAMEALPGNDDLHVLDKRIDLYERNIEAAGRADFGSIEPEGILKSDPVEWTERFEQVIDEAEAKVWSRIDADMRGLGFCHLMWHELQHVLACDYGIEWRSPARMNPRVMFD